jgi:threonine aldolase
MRQAMADAVVGDDVLGDDPTVKKLEELAAETMNMEAALFVPTGTMGNTIAMKLAAGDGNIVIMEEKCHIFHYESGNIGRICHALPLILPSDHGEIPIDKLRQAIPAVHRSHMPKVTAIALENTHNNWGGQVLSLPYMKQVKQLAAERNCHLHLDGARIFNAAVSLNIHVREISACFDSIMFCLSKGLSAPVGSMLAGKKEWIKEARLIRKYLGGGMRQAGVLAAPGIIALQIMPERLPEDHARMRKLAENIADCRGIDLDINSVQSNMMMLKLTTQDAMSFTQRLAEKKVLAIPFTDKIIRFVTHKDIDDHDIGLASGVIRELLNS